MNDDQPNPGAIIDLFEAVYPSFALLAGMELDLFSHLAGKQLSNEQLALALEVQNDKLRPLLYALVVAGVLTITDGLFSNTPAAEHFLVKGKPGYLGGTAELLSGNWSRLLNTATTIRTGNPPQNYDYHSMTQDESIAIFRGLIPGSIADARRLADQFDFSSCRTLLDVGGGSGALAIELVKAYPHINAVVTDLPSVTPITRHFIQEAGVGDRVKVTAADAVREPPQGSYDVVVARHVIQVLSEKESRALIKNLAAVTRDGGSLFLIGMVLDNSRLKPKTVVGFNLVLLTAYQEGQAYTEGEYFEWLAGAGFQDMDRTVNDQGSSIIHARKL